VGIDNRNYVTKLANRPGGIWDVVIRHHILSA
jgi:hypothetical protein